MLHRFFFLFAMTFAPTLHAEEKAGSQDVIVDPTTLPESVKAEGRKRFDAGMKALAEREYERAYNEFRAAYAVVPSLATLGNLGLAELETQRYVDAATHLRTVIRLERQRAREAPQFVLDAFGRVLPKVGRLRVMTEPRDAAVQIDGTVLPPDESVEEWFGAPGEHRVRIEKEGFATFERVTILQAGALTTVEAKLEPLAESASAAVSGAPSLSAPDTGPPPTRHEDTPARESKSSLSTKTIVVASGATLTLAAGVVGIVYAVKAGNANDRIDAEQRRAGSRACGASGCPDLDRALRDRESAGKGASAALNVTLVLGIATVATFFLWPSPSHSDPTASGRPRLHVGPTSVLMEMPLP